MTTNAQRLAARIREMDAAIMARQPIHEGGPVYPADNSMGATEYSHAILRYDAYAIGALSTLALAAAQELERAQVTA